MDLARLPFTLAALRAAYAGGLSPRAVIAEALARLRRADDPGIFLHLPAETDLIAAADALGPHDPDRPLWGMPFAVKDNIDVAGQPTTAACPAWRYLPAGDAEAVARLRAAGAIPLGKTNLDQFATGLVGIRTPHPAPRNACDGALVPGGSSSGSAVAVAHGIVPFALGTDTAGSGRVPAALNGIVGLKPTLGAVSSAGVVPACRTLDTVSILANAVSDAWEVLQVMAGEDPADPYSRRVRIPPLPAPLPAPRIAVPDRADLRFAGDRLQEASFEAALARLRALGADLVEIDFAPFHEVAAMLYQGAWLAERFGVIEHLLKTAPDAVHPVTRQVIAPAEGMRAIDAFRGFYRLAELRRICADRLAGADMLVVPSVPTLPGLAALADDPFGPNTMLGTYTNFVNLLDLAAVTVPLGPRGDGLPGSVTLIGRAGEDALLVAEAMRLQQGAGGEARAGGGTRATGEVGLQELVLAVCGLHMSGMPLNGQLGSAGARFLREARTAPSYRLHLLASAGAARPGLVRVASGGSAIGLELWALPKVALGDLIAGIPAPLGLGRVLLEDGESVPGFLCEAAAAEAAPDITAWGGWRAWLEAGAPGA